MRVGQDRIAVAAFAAPGLLDSLGQLGGGHGFLVAAQLVDHLPEPCGRRLEAACPRCGGRLVQLEEPTRPGSNESTALPLAALLLWATSRTPRHVDAVQHVIDHAAHAGQLAQLPGHNACRVLVAGQHHGAGRTSNRPESPMAAPSSAAVVFG